MYCTLKSKMSKGCSSILFYSSHDARFKHHADTYATHRLTCHANTTQTHIYATHHLTYHSNTTQTHIPVTVLSDNRKCLAIFCLELKYGNQSRFFVVVVFHWPDLKQLSCVFQLSSIGLLLNMPVKRKLDFR